tara:strand:- start:966 stop:1529 length:564 start_codon:yes stop_codon:yes gene_type:complete
LKSGKFNLHKNALGATQFAILKSTISSGEFPWFFQRDTTYGTGVSFDSSYHGFRHCLIKDNQKNSDSTELFVPVAWTVCDLLGGVLHEIYSMHLNLIENYNIETPPRPHTDRQLYEPNIDKMYTAILYFDQVDGNTVFYADDGETIIYEQTPIENAMIIFPAKTWHSGSNPLIAPFRRVLNINITLR